MNDLNRKVSDLSSGVVAEQKEFEARLKKLSRWNKEEDAERAAALRQYRDHLKELERAEQAAVDQITEHKQNIQNINSSMAKLQASRDEHLKNAKKGDARAAKLAADEQLLINKMIKGRAAAKKSIDVLTHQMGESAKLQRNIVSKMVQVEQELGKFSWKDTGKKVAGRMGDAVSTSIKNVMGGLSVTKAVTDLYSGLGQVMATGGDNLFASMSQQYDVVKLGLTPEEYIKMNAASRQTILAAGGVSKQMDILASQSDSLRGHFATMGEATQYTQGQMDALARAGIKPSVDSAGLLTGTFKKLQAYTGMTGEQFNALTAELATDQDIQEQLRAASSEERKQIMASTTARMAERVALGMTTDQAKNVTKALAKMGNMAPTDRIKQAAKLRAMGGAMGIEGADEAADIMIKGKRASPEELKRLEEFHSNMSNKMSDSQMGSLSAEIFASKIQEKLGTADTAATSEFNTKLAEGMKIADDSLKEQKKVPELLEKLIMVTSQGKAALASPVVQAAGGVMNTLWESGGSVAAGAAGGAAVAKAAPYLSKLLPGAASAGTGAAATGAGTAVGGAGRALAAGAGTAALVVGGGYVIDAGAGALGVGKKKVNEAQDDANWDKASMSEKIHSAIPRGIEKLGSLMFLDNLVNDARATRIDSETAYLQSKDAPPDPLPVISPRDRTTTTNQQDSFADKVQSKLGTAPTEPAPTVVSPLTSADTRADTTSPIGLQLSKMEEANSYLKDLTLIAEKQVEVAEKQLAATVVSAEDRAEVFKTLASGNKFMTSYNTIA